jgi:internalin A
MKKILSLSIAFFVIITAIPLTFAYEKAHVFSVNLSRRDLTNEQLVEIIVSGGIPHETTVLWLQGNQITDLTPLSELTNLQHLDLGNNQITDLMPLSGLTNLQILNLRDNQITDLTPLSKLTNLQNLYLSRNQINDLTPLNDLTELQRLWLLSNQIDNLTPLRGLTNLQRLGLDNNPVNEAQIAELFELLGLDEDGSRPLLTTADALTVLRAVAGLAELTDAQIARFGIDGEPTSADAMRILRTVAGL